MAAGLVIVVFAAICIRVHGFKAPLDVMMSLMLTLGEKRIRMEERPL